MFIEAFPEKFVDIVVAAATDHYQFSQSLPDLIYPVHESYGVGRFHYRIAVPVYAEYGYVSIFFQVQVRVSLFLLSSVTAKPLITLVT